MENETERECPSCGKIIRSKTPILFCPGCDARVSEQFEANKNRIVYCKYCQDTGLIDCIEFHNGHPIQRAYHCDCVRGQDLKARQFNSKDEPTEYKMTLPSFVGTYGTMAKKTWDEQRKLNEKHLTNYHEMLNKRPMEPEVVAKSTESCSVDMTSARSEAVGICEKEGENPATPRLASIRRSLDDFLNEEKELDKPYEFYHEKKEKVK